MKRIFLTILLIAAVIPAALAQKLDCGTVPLSKEKIQEIEKIAATFGGVSSGGITHFPLKLHLTKESGYTNYYPVSQVAYEVSKLNEKFLPFGYQFYLCDTVNYIDGSTLDYLAGSYNYSDSLALAANNVNNAINLYYVNFSNAGGRSNFPSGDKFYNWMFVRNGNFDHGETLIHEMGHYFNLYHTFTTTFGAELANGSNCSTAGDLVCDTAADVSPNTYDKISCVYTGTATDGNGQAYMPSMTNYMSYYSGGCIHDFTAGQYARAQAGHASRLSLIATEGNQYDFSYPSNDTINVFNVRAFELYGSVRLRWYANAYSLGFIVERSLSPNSGFVAIGTNPSTYLLEFIDKDVQAGVTYYYRVKAITSAESYSPVASFTPSSNSYSYGSAYTAAVHDVRFIFFNNASGLSLNIFFPNYLDPYSDYSNNIRSIETGEKYRVRWGDHNSGTPNLDSFKVWIDLNQNKVFENSEIVAKGYGEYSDDSIALAASIPTGFYRMRFRTNHFDTAFSDSDRQLYTDSKDITLFITGGCGTDLAFIDYQFGDFYSGTVIKTTDYLLTYPFEGYPLNFSAPAIELNPGFLADGISSFSAEPNGCP